MYVYSYTISIISDTLSLTQKLKNNYLVPHTLTALYFIGHKKTNNEFNECSESNKTITTP